MGKLACTRLLASLSLLPLLAGCAGSIGENSSQNSDASNPSPTFDTSDGRVLAGGERFADNNILSVTKTRFQETVTSKVRDEFGEYSVTRISYPSIDSVKNKGVSKASLAAALEFFTDFVSTEVIDSVALDNYSNYDKWVREIAPKYIASEFLTEITDAQANGSFAGIIFNNHDPTQPKSTRQNLMPVLMRDGGPRVFNKQLWDLRAEPSSGGLYISTLGSALIITDDKKALEWDKKVMGPGGETFPRFSDGILETANLTFQMGLTLIPDGDSWKIAGFSSYFSADVTQFITDTPQSLIDWRNAIR